MTVIRAKLIPLALSFILVLFGSIAYSQSFNFIVPDQLSVCQSDDFQISITNNTGATISGIELEVSLPCQVEYVIGSAQNAIAINIDDLSHPVFRLANLENGASITVIMDLFASCENISCIDDGDQFFNTINFSGSQGNQEVNTPLYKLETALPVITKIENPIMPGIKGQTIERLITITNTRPGFLDTLRFSDAYVNGLSISSDIGQDISSTNGIFEILLVDSDFRKIGDGDGLFEFNEEIVIREIIQIDACGFDISAVRSELDVTWGCEGQSCPSPFKAQTALIDLDYIITEGEVLTFHPQANQPLCLCQPEPTSQSMIINNFSDNHAAKDVSITINTVQFRKSAIPDAPIQLIRPSGTIWLEGNFSEPEDLNCGNDSTDFYTKFIVVIPEILPGEEVELVWDVFFCNSDICFSDLYQFNYNYRYNKDCTLRSDDFYAGADLARTNLPYLLNAEIESTEAFEYLQTANINFLIASPLITDNAGTLDIQLDFPCHLEVLEENWLYNGVSPLNVMVDEQEGGMTIVNLSYPLPLNFNSGVLEFDVQFVCNDKCQDDLCKDNIVTTCPSVCNADAFVFTITAEVELNFDECEGICLTSTCPFQLYFFDCELPYCDIFISGYLDSEFNMYRLNRGLPDNDNDHFPDASGTLDEDKIRLDRAITGDTIRMEVTGEIVIDIPGESFTKGLLDLNMKQLTSEGIHPNFQQLEFIRLLNGETGFATVKKELKIVDASSGDVYFCDDVPAINVTGVGERSFNIDIEQMIANGCNIPVDYKYENGDSIYFVADFFIKYNFNSLLLNYGSMDIEFLNNNTMYEGELGSRDDLFSCGCPTERITFANYKTAVTSTATNIDFCNGFGEGGEFKVLKYGTFSDFFPFEYKPTLALNYLMMPRVEGLDLVSTRLVSLTSNQDLVIVDIDDPSSYIDLDFSQTVDDTIVFEFVEDVIGYYLINPTENLNVSWDENLEFRIEYEYQNQGCIFVGSQDYLGSQDISYSLGVSQTNVERDQTHGVVMLGKQAVLNTNISLCDVTALSDKLTWELDLIAAIFNNDLLSNQIYNVWFYPESENGALTDFVLTDRESGLQFEEINGVFQLDSVADMDTILLNLTALSSSCDREEIIFNFGWDCAPYVDTLHTPCFSSMRTCFGEAPPGVIDLLPEELDLESNLCDTFPYTEIFIFNAGLGPLNQLIFEVDLPRGLVIANGTSQVEYPNGSMNFLAINDPQLDAQGNPFWIIDEELLVLQTNGLPGVTTSPDNGLILRFKTISDCDFISGSRLLYNIDVQRSCGGSGNNVSKFSSPLSLKDIPEPNSTFLDIGLDDINACEDILDIAVQFMSDVPTGPFNDILITIPDGMSFVPNSCNGDLPDCQPVIDSTLMIWHLPEGVTSLDFSFQLSGLSTLACEQISILANSTIETNANCIVDGSDCRIRVSTAEVIFTRAIQRPIFEIQSVNVSVNEDNLNQADINLNIINVSGIDSDSVNISLYLDLDGSGTFTAGDQYVGDFTFDQLIESGKLYQISLPQVNLSIDDLCHLLVVIEERNNCVCLPAEKPFTAPIEVESNQVYELCSGDTIPIGTIEESGHDYIWDIDEYIDCTNCSTTNFTAINSGFQPFEILLYQLDNDGSGCVLNRHYRVVVHPQPAIWSADEEICVGEEVVLLASDADSYMWSGEGITEPSEQVQTVSPVVSSSYTVTITDTIGCMAVDTAFVTVLDLPVANAGEDILACFGQEVSLMAENLDSTYFYFWTPSNPFLDDPTSISPIVLVSQSQVYVLEVSDNQCEAYDTVQVNFYDGLDITTPDTIIACYGDPISISLPDGILYNWSPLFLEMCVDEDCSEVTFTPENTLTMTVTGINEDMCADTSLIEIVIINLDDPEIDALMICEGDEIEIYNQIVSAEGLYCDTTASMDGCAMIECIDLSFFNIAPLNITVSDSVITPGLEVQFNASSGFADYVWEVTPTLSCLDCPDPNAVLFETETFFLTVTDQNGCTRKDQITINVREECDIDEILIPNAFTANNNSLNDKFRIANSLSRDMNTSIEIYDRWGELLYQENGNNGWDGTYKNEQVPEGVYLYIIRVDCGDGLEKMYKGDVTLIR